MTDITGREIKVGDILAVGQRYGNSGTLDIRVVAGFREYEKWAYTGKVKKVKIKTTIGSYLLFGEKTIIVPKEIFKGTKMEEEIEQECKKAGVA